VDVKGLPCWPTEPLVYTTIDGKKVKQIADGDKLKGVNLESRWSGWTNVGKVTLKQGDHFDQVVLGITVSGLQFICDEKLKALEPWQKMLASVQTVRTQAVQLWFNRPSGSQVATTPTPPQPPPGMGTPVPDGIIANCTEPDACWADFNQVLDREDQPPDVLGLFYGCGVLQDEGPEFPPPDDLAFPAEQLARVRKTTVEFLQGSAGQVWPKATVNGTLDWTALVALDGEVGEARLDSQYLRVNIDPSERYVLSLVNSSQFRLKAGGSGVKNLFLAGSWVDNGNNLSCVEAAAMSGMQASRAISGVPSVVFGEDGFPKVTL
jgi:uncharacterized protein with NAD-binding domain and iron-sulfur cluster